MSRIGLKYLINIKFIKCEEILYYEIENILKLNYTKIKLGD